jgi:ubiquinone/menaquinone biosynthesis C-methylase UbiE
MIKTVIREWIFRIWYRYVHSLDKNGEVQFMNYGYANPNVSFNIHPDFEHSRYSAQLYHLLASDVDLKERDVLEIGSGRGGGLYYLTKTFSPRLALGVDLTQESTDFCNKHYSQKGLSFKQGDAQNLSFLKDNSFDVIVNVESSHRYPRMHLFLKEAYRLLRSNGFLLYTDFRYGRQYPELKKQLSVSGLKILKEEVITEHVVQALMEDDRRKRMLVKKLAPFGIRQLALQFAATIGTGTFNKFKSGKFGYYRFLMQKI